MAQYILAVLGLSALCGAWVVVQRWIAKHDPGQPGVEGKCASCHRHHDSGQAHPHAH
jgi:hypothetical protein